MSALSSPAPTSCCPSRRPWPTTCCGPHTKLKWVQALGTGVDNLDRPAIAAPGCHRHQRARHSRGAGLGGGHRLDAGAGARRAAAVRAQDARQWLRWPAQLLHNKTVGIFGVGAIAAELAPKCKAFGMRVVGISATRVTLRASTACSRATILPPPCASSISGAADAAHRRDTRHRRREGARGDETYRLSRSTSRAAGSWIEPALVEALQPGRIAGAALDVFTRSRCPTAIRSGRCTIVIITTHQGGFCDVYIDHALPTVAANMRHFLAGDLAG